MIGMQAYDITYESLPQCSSVHVRLKICIHIKAMAEAIEQCTH